jgi:type III secretion regulatory protein HpaA
MNLIHTSPHSNAAATASTHGTAPGTPAAPHAPTTGTPQSAQLYRGTTVFSYGSSQANSNASARARRLTDALARKRRLAQRRTRNGAGGVEDTHDGGGHHDESQRVSREGGGGGGRGGQSHDQHSHGDGNEPAAFRPHPAGSVPAPRPGALQHLADTHADEAQRAAAVRDLHAQKFAELRDELDTSPNAEIDSRMYELSLDWLVTQQKFGAFNPESSVQSKQRLLQHAPAGKHGPQPDASAAGPVAGFLPGAAPAPKDPQVLTRKQRLNLLAALFLLNSNRPSTPSQREQAIATLSLLRAGALTRMQRNAR